MPLEFQRGTVFVEGTRRKMWYGKYRVWQKDPATNTYTAKQRTKKIGPKSEMTKFEAQERLRQMIAADNANAPEVPADVAPSELTLEWFVVNRHLPMMSCRATTKKSTEYEIRRYIFPAFGSRLLKEIGLFELQTHLNKLAENFSDSVVRHTYVNLRSIFNNAIDLDFMTKSPTRRLMMPDTKPTDKTVISAGDFMRLITALDDPMDRCVLILAGTLALRTAEVFGLTWGAYRGNHLAIENTAYEGKLQANKVKTADSRALVPIPDLAKPYIEEWRKQCKDTSPGALMFPTTGKGRRVRQPVPFDSTNFMERRIHPVADRLGISRRLVRFQVLRRTLATDLQDFGTMKDAQAALRHQSIKTTANVYMQPVPESVAGALNARTRAVFAEAAENPDPEKKRQ
jgi:integrase